MGAHWRAISTICSVRSIFDPLEAAGMWSGYVSFSNETMSQLRRDPVTVLIAANLKDSTDWFAGRADGQQQPLYIRQYYTTPLEANMYRSQQAPRKAISPKRAFQ